MFGYTILGMGSPGTVGYTGGLFGSRGLFAGGSSNVIDYINLSGGTGATATDFGDLTVHSNRHYLTIGSDAVRAVIQGGQGPVTDMEFVSIGTPGNGVEFGDLTVARQYLSSESDGSRGVTVSSGVIDYFTFQTPGDAADFGDPTENGSSGGAVSDGTRMVYSSSGSPMFMDTLNIASVGDATEFGDMAGAQLGAGADDTSRGCFFGGHDGSAYVNNIDYIAISTPNDATDFGDDSVAGDNKAGTGDGSRGMSVSGHADNRGIRYFNIDSLGDAVSFGQLSTARSIVKGATSGN
jgi:hypothetical protein